MCPGCQGGRPSWGRASWRPVTVVGRVPPSVELGWGSFLFRRSGPRRVFVGAVSASQFPGGPSSGQKRRGACRGRRLAAAWAAGLERLVAREHVPGGDQDLARDGRLGGVAAVALGDIEVELMPR